MYQKFSWFKIVSLALSLNLVLAPAIAKTAAKDIDADVRELILREKMIRELDGIQSILETTYAPACWKKERYQWSLELAVDEAKQKVWKKKGGAKEFHRTITQFFNSMKDYHVGVSFFATEEASLPLNIKGYKGRYFLTAIDREKLPLSSFPFAVGDEMIAFDGKPIQQAIAEMQAMLPAASPLTDQSLAELKLTHRLAANGDTIPSGPISIVVKGKGEKEEEKSYELVWEYERELMDDGSWKKGFASRDAFFKALLAKKLPLSQSNSEHLFYFLKHPMMKASFALAHFKGLSKRERASTQREEPPHVTGGRNSFIPDLGKVIWRANSAKINAYIFQTDQRSLVGYLRIPAYVPLQNADDYLDCSDDFASYKEIIEHLELHTDALVVDQVNNPGGYLFTAYALASLLIDKPVAGLPEQVLLSADLVFAMHSFLQLLEHSDPEIEPLLAQFLVEPLETTPQVALRIKDYCRFIISEWQQGKKFTDLCYYLGIDQIMPASIHYTKPILMLINELDFSCGDVVPAILQDSKRATLMGVKTAGAGGSVIPISYPNRFAIDTFTTTCSLIRRADHQPLENLGVTPDLLLEVTEEDLQQNYRHYIKEVVQAIEKLVKAQ